MVRETDKEYIFKRKRSAVLVYDESNIIYLQIYDPFVLGPVRLLIQLPEKVCKIWEVSD